jgi:hypothetical protein
MKKLIRFTGQTWLTAVGIVMMTIWVGRQQQLPSSVAALHLTNCELPCWIGIIPTKTTMAEAEERIKQIFSAEFTSNKTHLFAEIKKYNFSIIVRPLRGMYGDDAKVGSISLGIPDPDQYQTVGTILSLWGPPDRILVRTVYSVTDTVLFFDKTGFYAVTESIAAPDCYAQYPQLHLNTLYISPIRDKTQYDVWRGFRTCYSHSN